MAAYYNEIDAYAAEWLRNLIAAGHIAPGDVDERDIREVAPDDLRNYTQCHFFAGIGVWSLALRRAGWPDERPVWTGSCPCQPFSVAGLAGGFDDERHLWPFFHHLIGQRRPPVVFGEQVASRDGLDWLDLVQADLEGTGYASAAVDLCAAGVGAPHIRQRLWFVANSLDAGLQGRLSGGAYPGREYQSGCAGRGGAISGLAYSNRGQRDRFAVVRGIECDGSDAGRAQGDGESLPCIEDGRVGDTVDIGCVERRSGATSQERDGATRDGGVASLSSNEANGIWRDSDWLRCKDGKWRPVEPGTFPLAHGAASRVGRLRAYGNAINAEAATVFITAAIGSL